MLGTQLIEQIDGTGDINKTYGQTYNRVVVQNDGVSDMICTLGGYPSFVIKGGEFRDIIIDPQKSIVVTTSSTYRIGVYN